VVIVMPKDAVEPGAAESILPRHEMARAILRFV
jgi:hypothetical protein